MLLNIYGIAHKPASALKKPKAFPTAFYVHEPDQLAAAVDMAWSGIHQRKLMQMCTRAADLCMSFWECPVCC